MNQQFKLPALTAARTHQKNRRKTIFDDSQQTMLIYNCRAEVLLGCFKRPARHRGFDQVCRKPSRRLSTANPIFFPLLLLFNSGTPKTMTNRGHRA